ncbi:cytochrome C [Halarcobacter ebronensis]|uniref:Cytochrome C n=1 Tax=Halarcobacter ebronensis TaxID=1462615 RepID=A0A4Q0YGF3_9BACT|nr:cytochrome C [Halarcobacter ebronensis]RXJ69682.1 cytochrome C [Halarcobacter ebronensis]
MHPSFIKSKIYATLALIIMTIGFTFPMVAFHGTLNKIHDNRVNEISPLAIKVWNFYNEGRYKSTTTPKEAHNDLEKMIETSSEIGVASFPIWTCGLEAPNYPKKAFPEGIPVFFHFDGFSGEVHEMNTINHYVGMDPMWRGGRFEREVGIYALLGLSLFMVYFILYHKKILTYIMWIVTALPLIFIAEYSYWLYWFGHNLHDWGAFKIKPFMPTVFGDGKIAQFTTHSYPNIGFFTLVVIGLLGLLAVLSRNKAFRETKKAEKES